MLDECPATCVGWRACGDPVADGGAGAVDAVFVELAGEGGGDAVRRGAGGEDAEAAEEVDADAGGDELAGVVPRGVDAVQGFGESGRPAKGFERVRGWRVRLQEGNVPQECEWARWFCSGGDGDEAEVVEADHVEFFGGRVGADGLEGELVFSGGEGAAAE